MTAKLAKEPIIFEVEFIVEPDGTGFHAYCPSLKGLHMEGATREEALANAKDAAIAYLRSLIKHGEPIPLKCVEPSKVIKLPSRQKKKAYVEGISVAV
jgi:predicted RNase H-like HicB family nuclease